MAQPITDYAAFFAGAKQAVEELEQLKQQERQLEETEKQLEKTLKTKQQTIADTISQTVKQRADEISRSYDVEIGKLQDRLKKVKSKREKAKTQGIKERIAEDTQELLKENEEWKGRIKNLFRVNHVPTFCSGRLYYSLYFTRGLKETLIMLAVLLIFFLAVPCGIYLLIPARKTWYLIGIYVGVIGVFGGIYVKIGNSTKIKYMDVLKEGRDIHDRIRANKKQIKAIVRAIRKDKNDNIYNLQKFDDEIAQLNQDLAQTNKKKKDALSTFESVTKTILSDEIMANNKAELERLEAELSDTVSQLKNTRIAVKEKALYITDHFEVFVGKEFVTAERLEALEKIIAEGAAGNISEAVSVFKSREYDR